MNQDLINYISRGRGAGVPDDKLRDILLGSGWLADDIDQALSEAGSHLPIINALPSVADHKTEWATWHRRAFFAVIIMILIVAVGAVMAVAYQFYQQNRSPERVVGEVLSSFADVTSFKYDGSLMFNFDYQATFVGDSTSSVKLPPVAIDKSSVSKVAFSGLVSAPHNGRPRIELTSKIDRTDLTKNTVAVDLKTRLIDDNLYLNLEHIDRLPLLDLRSLIGVWLRISPADIASLGLDYVVTAPSVNQLLSWRSGIARTRSISLSEKLGVETLSGVPVLHYRFTAPAEDFNVLINKIHHLIGGREVSQALALAAAGDTIDGEVWVGEQDQLPYRVVIKSKMINADDRQSVGDFSLDLKMADFNQPVSVAVPNQAKPISSFFEELTKNTASSTPLTVPKP